MISHYGSIPKSKNFPTQNVCKAFHIGENINEGQFRVLMTCIRWLPTARQKLFKDRQNCEWSRNSCWSINSYWSKQCYRNIDPQHRLTSFSIYRRTDPLSERMRRAIPTAGRNPIRQLLFAGYQNSIEIYPPEAYLPCVDGKGREGMGSCFQMETKGGRYNGWFARSF